MIESIKNHILRSELANLQAYTVAHPGQMIKLDAMENPYTWPDSIKSQWLEHLSRCEINRYPDPGAGKLVDVLKKLNPIPDNYEILLGNGSDEIIQLLLMAAKPGSSILSPHPGFVMYKQIAISLGLNYQSVTVHPDDFSMDVEGMLEAIKTSSPSIIFIAYPNNPTGNLFNRDDIIQLIEHCSGLVILDEAYPPFAKASFIDLLSQYPNLMVMRTVSKLGLAGLRLGYLIGHQELIHELNKIRLPYNINSLTQITSEFALQHQNLFTEQTDQICQDRQWLYAQLADLANIQAFPSSANFILFRTLPNQADIIDSALKQQGILIKNLSRQGGLLQDCLRVTVGTTEENQIFIDALKKIIKNSSC